MGIPVAGKIQSFLWGHSRSFTHIEILAVAAAAGGVCVCVCWWTATSHQLLQNAGTNPFTSSDRFSFFYAAKWHCNSNTKRLKKGLVAYSTAMKHGFSPLEYLSLNRHNCVRFIQVCSLSSIKRSTVSSSPRMMLLPVNMSVTQMNCSDTVA